MLTACSGLLLSHYITETAPTMTTWLGASNSCLSSVLPIAYIDDLAMHSVLALGGAHLCSKKADNTEVMAATKSHYDFVLRGVRLALHELKPEDTMKVLRILLVLVLTAHYEASSISRRVLLISHMS
jgi:Fungal specific transcription factor domain